MSDNNNININTPEIGPYTQLQPFRFWCQKVLPLVYDESLSYYELLCKVVDYLNKTMEDVDQMITDMGEFQTADRDFKTDMVDRFIAFTRGVDQTLIRLEDYMRNYFNNLNVQTEINNKLDAMAEAGYFDTLFTTLFTDDIITESRSVTSTWISENLLQETGYVIDNSLTVENAAADAKATGDKIRSFDFLKTAPCQYIDLTNITQGQYYGHGSISTSSGNNVGTLNYTIPIFKGVTYAYENIYAYYSNIVNDDGTITPFTETNSQFTGTITPTKNGIAYITVLTGVDFIINAKFCNCDTAPVNDQVGFYDKKADYNLIEKLPQIIQSNDIEFIPPISEAIQGYYYSHSAISTSATATAAILKPIRVYKDIEYTFSGLYAYFCLFKDFTTETVTALSNTTGANESGTFTPAHDGALYLTCAISNGNYSYSPSLKANNATQVVITSSDADIIQKLLDSKGKDIHFAAGNYNIIAIYEAHFGSDYFTNYVNYNSGGNNLGAGLPIYNGTKMTFSEGAYFTCNYTGDNQNVRNNFSAFYLESGVTIDGLQLVSSGIRNCLHDDFDNSNEGTTIIKNCILSHNGVIIAGGLGLHDKVIIKDNIFKNTGTDHNFDFSYHNNGSSGAKSLLIIKDNYCNKGVSIRYYGTSTLQTEVMINNNSFAYPIEKRAENESALIDNVTITEWNNEIR